MKKTVLSGLLLTLLLMSPALLQAEDPRPQHARGDLKSPSSQAKDPSTNPPQVIQQVQTSPVPSPTGTAEELREQARHSDDLGQSSTVLAIQVRTYDQLVAAIRRARAASQARVEQAVQQEKVRECWETGKLIDEHVLQHKERADYADRTLIRLAGDLETSETELRYMLQFARTYPIHRPADELSWSHYESLMAVNDPGERRALAEKAVKEKWTRDQVREEVSKRKSAKNETPVPVQEAPLTAQPGKPGTYKIVKAQTGPYAGELAVDLGFSNYIRLAEVAEDMSPFKEGDIVASSKDTKGHYSLQSVPSPNPLPKGEDKGEGALDTLLHPPSDIRLLYTYQAWVYRVLDGDTIEAVIDLGFGITTTQTLRLRGLDAPELVSKEGKEAKAFLEQKLKIAEGVPSTATGEEPSRDTVPRTPYGTEVLIRTVKSDKYDRYLVDIFLPARSLKASAGGTGATGHQYETGETYVNQELLEKGHAVRVRE